MTATPERTAAAPGHAAEPERTAARPGRDSDPERDAARPERDDAARPGHGAGPEHGAPTARTPRSERTAGPGGAAPPEAGAAGGAPSTASGGAPLPARGEDPFTASGEDWLRLDRQICFSLHAAARAFNGVYRVVLKDLGLTYPQYLVMLVLWEHGTLPVKRLGEHLRLDSGTLSPLLKRLEAAGYVRRERSTRDERSVEVRLTGEGVALRERALRVPRRVAAATGLGLDEMRELRAGLDRLTRALDAAALEEAPDCGGDGP